MKAPLGLVLAGGAGRRLGRDKGALRVAGVSLARRAADTLAPLCSEVWISVGPDASNPAPAYRAIADAAPAGRGPLAGIDAAFGASDEVDLLVLACDYPCVDRPLLERLLDIRRSADVTLFRDPTGRAHPLVALWSRSMQAPVREALDHGRLRVGALLDLHAVGEIELERALVNVNRMEDLDRLRLSLD